MGAIEGLKRDHRLLRSKLDMLRGAVSTAPESWLVLRNGCFTLSRLLQAHCAREHELLTACHAGLERAELAQTVMEHQERLQSLRILNRCFVVEEGPPPATKDVCGALTAVVEGLDDELHLQEDELFPALERLVEDRQEGGSHDDHTARPVLSEEQTVTRVVQRYPQTQAVFDRFGVNLAYEGYDDLGEVAWRHGMPGEELLTHLEQAIASHARQAG